MVKSLLANIGIILLNVYFVWKLGIGLSEPKRFTFKQVIQFITLESLMGISLIVNSFPVLETRFDFRSILFAFSMKYLGPKVTLPTIMIVALSRFFFQGALSSSLNMVVSVIFVLTIVPIFEWSKKHFKGRGQLLTIGYYFMFLTLPIIFYTVGGVRHSVIVYSIVIAIGTLLMLIVNGVMRDLERLSNLSVIDGLTNLYNSRKLHQDLEQLSKHRRRYSLVVLDIDNFKQYNDYYGHLIGDKVILEVSKRLEKISENDSRFYRYGGEEFVTIIETEDDGKEAYKIATQVQKEVQAIQIILENGEKLTATVSIGIAYQWHEEPLLSTFDRADQALYVAKLNGKDQIIIG